MGNYGMNKREIYVAAPFIKKEAAQDVRVKLERQGWEVTSGWLDTPYGPEEDSPLILREEAFRDIRDIHRAEAFLLLNWPGSQGGMLVELGIALARGKKIYLLDGGGGTNVFMNLPDIVRVSEVERVVPT